MQAGDGLCKTVVRERVGTKTEKKIMKHLLSSVIGLALMASASPVLANDQSGDLPEELDGYHLEGTVEKCLTKFSIDRTTAVDDYNIVFEMKNGDLYLNRLNHRCPRLGFEDSFAYKTVGNRICKGTIISIIHDDGQIGASCSLGNFHLLEEDEE